VRGFEQADLDSNRIPSSRWEAFQAVTREALLNFDQVGECWIVSVGALGVQGILRFDVARGTDAPHWITSIRTQTMQAVVRTAIYCRGSSASTTCSFASLRTAVGWES